MLLPTEKRFRWSDGERTVSVENLIGAENEWPEEKQIRKERKDVSKRCE